MSTIFADPRFGDGVRPSPANYSLYLSDVYWLPYPTAISANANVVGMSGINISTPVAPLCDYSTLAASPLGVIQSVWLVGYEAIAVQLTGHNLQVSARPAPGAFEDVVFPYPPTTGGVDARAVRVTDTSGAVVFAEDRTGMSWESDGQGVRFVTFAGSSEVCVSAGEAAALTLYSGTATGTGSLTVVPAANTPVAPVRWSAGDGSWSALATVTVPAGESCLRIDGAIGADAVLLREGLPLP